MRRWLGIAPVELLAEAGRVPPVSVVAVVFVAPSLAPGRLRPPLPRSLRAVPASAECRCVARRPA
eukprot:5152533-Prorocentrum_lima.AAC.1